MGQNPDRAPTRQKSREGPIVASSGRRAGSRMRRPSGVTPGRLFLIPVKGRDETRQPYPIGPFRDHPGVGLMTLRRAG